MPNTTASSGWQEPVPGVPSAAERMADAILHAAGSGLRHYTLHKTRSEIIAAAQSALDEAKAECARHVRTHVPEGAHPDDLYRWSYTAGRLAASLTQETPNG